MRRSSRAIAALLCAALLLVPPLAGAAPTDPVMVLAAGEAHGSWIGIQGEFPAADLVQAPIVVQVLVRELASGTGFVRFELGGGAFEGVEPALADGLDTTEALALASAGSVANARVLFVGAARLELLLPPGFRTGPLEVQLFSIDAEGATLSNPLVVTGGAP